MAASCNGTPTSSPVRDRMFQETTFGVPVPKTPFGRAANLVQGGKAMERRIIPLVFFIIMSVLLGGCSLLPQEEADAVPTLIDPPESRTVTYEAQLGTITEEIHTTGRVAPFKEATHYFTQ